jgi:hypothetical protein
VSQVSDELGERLARVVPQLEPLDWDDVAERSQLLRRVQAPRRHGRLRVAPRVLLVAAIVVLMGGSLALALGGRVLDAVSGSPAPPHVKTEFKQLVHSHPALDGPINAPPIPKRLQLGGVVRGSERHILDVRTSIGTRASLYVARTTHGLECIDLIGRLVGFKGCVRSRGGAIPFWTGLNSWIRTPTKAHLNVREWVIAGRAASPLARTVRVVYRGGTHHDIVLRQGWFVFEVPERHTLRPVAPIRLDVLSAAGARLGSLHDPFPDASVPPLPRVRHFATPVSSSMHELARASLPNGSGIVTISAGRDAAGHLCFRHLHDARSNQFPVWDCSAMVGSYGYALSMKHVPVEWQMGLRNDGRKTAAFGYAYAFGYVAPGITRLTLRFQGGAAQDIALHERFFLYIVPSAHWAAGHRPSILEARAASGALVYRRFLYPTQHCIYPGTDPVCKHQGIGTG